MSLASQKLADKLHEKSACVPRRGAVIPFDSVFIPRGGENGFPMGRFEGFVRVFRGCTEGVRERSGTQVDFSYIACVTFCIWPVTVGWRRWVASVGDGCLLGRWLGRG